MKNDKAIEVVKEYKEWFDIDGDKDVSQALQHLLNVARRAGNIKKLSRISEKILYKNKSYDSRCQYDEWIGTETSKYLTGEK